MPIHHYGKSEETGLRGSSAYRGGADAVLSVLADRKEATGQVGVRSLNLAKTRHGEEGPIAVFELRFVQLGLDGDGDAFGACVVDPALSVESLIYATAPTLLAVSTPCALRVNDVLTAFEVQLELFFRHPENGGDASIGIEAVRTRDLAHLLIKLEATGFAVDPAPLCAMLRRRLRSREHLSLAEMAVWWHPKERHRSAPRILATGERSTWGDRAEEMTTPTGYRAELFRGPDGEPTALVVMAPKHHPVAA